MNKSEVLWELPKLTKRYKVNKCYWKNGADRLDGCTVATNLQFIKKNIICKAQ